MMSNNSELVAELVVHNAHCVISGYLGACLFTLRGCAPLFGASLALWSELTRAQALPKTARDLVRTRADDIFSEWCMRSEGLLEARAACAWCDTPVWEYCAPVALTPGARLLSEIARTFEARRNVRATPWRTSTDRDSTNVRSSAQHACDAFVDAAMRRVAARVLTSDERLQGTAAACKEALQRATREVSSEYERDDMFAVAFRKRGVPLHTVRNWIVPSETEASRYFVDSSSSISWRGESIH